MAEEFPHEKAMAKGSSGVKITTKEFVFLFIADDWHCWRLDPSDGSRPQPCWLGMLVTCWCILPPRGFPSWVQNLQAQTLMGTQNYLTCFWTCPVGDLVTARASSAKSWGNGTVQSKTTHQTLSSLQSIWSTSLNLWCISLSPRRRASKFDSESFMINSHDNSACAKKKAGEPCPTLSLWMNVSVVIQ